MLAEIIVMIKNIKDLKVLSTVPGTHCICSVRATYRDNDQALIKEILSTFLNAYSNPLDKTKSLFLRDPNIYHIIYILAPLSSWTNTD